MSPILVFWQVIWELFGSIFSSLFVRNESSTLSWNSFPCIKNFKFLLHNVNWDISRKVIDESMYCCAPTTTTKRNPRISDAKEQYHHQQSTQSQRKNTNSDLTRFGLCAYVLGARKRGFLLILWKIQCLQLLAMNRELLLFSTIQQTLEICSLT